ncbi:hypothetical protein LGL08_22245 [Clostridium estertheticum]|uniref:hypothetical protein n=1 Tax=Clostridium estertheticum TaxID=238834 RepID=UPI001CF1C330|nr:hypothetical protein [Clostridium estertheticum]MCB2309242.1 hypothetical protein [Clostridium estertheticum]MCB2346885.1 hypothetical protein [Clostridium estertheticum]MCB2352247.1 hypothetical protein [Clostridium estertheticum]WAG48548.1 hypothetical protein LL127_23555 [Clostridium estertheticum]
MNKKFITSLLICTFCISSFTNVFAAEKGLNNPPSTSSKCIVASVTNSETNIEDFLKYDNGFLKLEGELPKNEEQSMKDYVVTINELITNNQIKINNKFEISKINQRSKRDVTPGVWRKVGYLSHSQIQTITGIAAWTGSGTTARGVYPLVKEMMKKGIAGISRPDGGSANISDKTHAKELNG